MKTGWQTLCRVSSCLTIFALVGAGLLLLGGCPQVQGPPGPQGPAGTDTGTLAGTVTNSSTGAGIAGATVTIDPAVEGVDIVVAADGTYSAVLPIGVYTLMFESDNFESQTATVSVVAGETATADAALMPTAAVIVSVSVDGTAAPGGTVTATATVETLDGSTITGYEWTQMHSVDATITGATSATATVTLPGTRVYKDELFALLAEPPIGADDLPPNVPLPEGEFPGGLQDRFEVVGLSPFILEEAGLVGLEVAVTTSSGTYLAEAEIHTMLPWKANPGLRNVPIGIPVLLHGKTQSSYNWALSRPAGSGASLTDGATQNPYFTPDVAGTYTVTVTDQAAAATVTLGIYAGTWEGAITGQDADGRPVATTCRLCHNGTFAPDLFTPWAQTGHAEIFTDSLDTSTHYSTSCMVCHTVGYDTDVDNDGIDDARDYTDFLDAFSTDGTSFHADPDNWTNMLADFEDSAQLANIQCENCHGPNITSLHFNEEFDSERISLSSDVCGVCHGEPARHGRFQQWQLSGHANYELAIDEGGNGNCARCHSANGFVAWEAVGFDPDTDVTADWTEDETHPQTCAACHDPHNVGTTTGEGTDAQPRITGDTPMLTDGFAVYGAGKGAVCMTCHSSRRGLRNDDTWPDTRGDDPGRAPHGAAQTAVLMGANAYLVDTGIRGSHSLVEDTCVNCHMRATDPPDLLSYNLGGTNHTFFASDDICADCHGELFDAEGIESAFEGMLDELLQSLEGAIVDEIAAQIAAGNTIDVEGEDEEGETLTATITDAADITDIEFGDSHGRQAITLTLTGGTVVAHVQMRDVRVIDGTDTDIGGLYDEGFADDSLPKAGWNWILLHNDGSHGVHNPSFAFDVLASSIAALNALP